MLIRKLLLGSLVAASFAALPAAARTNVDLIVNVAPPAPIYEVVPAPRVGYVWVPGFWAWRGHRHFWVAGHWTRHRPGYFYEPARWVERDGRWHYARPYWRTAYRY